MAPAKETEKRGKERSFYVDVEVSNRIDELAEVHDRSPSWIASRLLKQALGMPDSEMVPGARE